MKHKNYVVTKKKLEDAYGRMSGVSAPCAVSAEKNSGIESAMAKIVADLDRHLEKPEIRGRGSYLSMDGYSVVELARRIERLLDERGVTQANRIGTQVFYRPAGKEACKAYAKKAWGLASTHVHIKRVSDGWRLVEAKEAYSRTNQRELLVVEISAKARDDVLRRAMSGISLREKS